jgi:hypothetical protein
MAFIVITVAYGKTLIAGIAGPGFHLHSALFFVN